MPDRLGKDFWADIVRIVEQMRIRLGYVWGDFGVGTAAPEEKFHVVEADDEAGLFERTGSETVTKPVVVKVKHTTSGDMANEFGASLGFYIEDDAGVEKMIGSVGARRRGGADNSGYAEFSIANVGVFTRPFKVYPQGIVVLQDVTNVSDPPTDAELDAIFGAPATLERGFMALLDDGDADTKVYLIVASDASWYYQAMTKAV